MSEGKSRMVLWLILAGMLAFCGGCSLGTGRGSVAGRKLEAFEVTGGELRILTIGTADSGGTMYPVGDGIAQLISQQNQDIKVNTSASNGSLTNVEGICSNQIDLGLVSGDVAFSAYHGTDDFVQKPAGNLRAIAALYPSISNWMAPASNGLIYVHDLSGKRLLVGPAGSTTELSARISLDAVGLDEGNAELKNYGLGSGALEVAKGSADAIHGFAGIPIPGLTELSAATPSRLLLYTQDELDRILTQNPYYYQTVIPAGTYIGQRRDVDTFGVKCLLCVNADMDEELVYRLTKSLDLARPELIRMHGTTASMEEETFMAQDLPIPLHPGALRYYKEMGYLNEDAQ